MTQPILSILVITHNQRELLKRCLDSVLGQKLNVPFEVIVSDDRSDDGTAEYMADLQDQITNDQLQITNLTQLVYTRCNSNDCDPKNLSERCGWNKLNAYSHAHGDFFVNIDADDYLRSDDIYQTQLDMLDVHPECSMCMQDVWPVRDGESQPSSQPWPSFGRLKNGQVLSAYDIVSDYRALNQCYMIRRHPEQDCAALYGKHFDDTIITLHHLQFGPVVYVDRADYAWVQYPQSISHKMANDEKLVTYGLLPLHHAEFIPSMRNLFLQTGLHDLVHLFKVAPQYPELSKEYYDFLKQFDGFVYMYYTETKHPFVHKIKYKIIRCYMLILSKYKWTNDCWYSILYRFLK